jgi:hypothetical protein
MLAPTTNTTTTKITHKESKSVKLLFKLHTTCQHLQYYQATIWMMLNPELQEQEQQQPFHCSNSTD